MHLRIGSGQDFAGGIIHIHLDEKRPRGGIDSVRRANQSALEVLPGKLLEVRSAVNPGSVACEYSCGTLMNTRTVWFPRYEIVRSPARQLRN